tara:strand:- start:9153 stop:9395 length:243 start_codon:yes stop_codon:yes gene_type:complete
MNTHYIEVSEGTHLEVTYKYYAQQSSNDYDVPPDPEEFEIEKIELVSELGVRIDITNLTEDLLVVLPWDKINEEIYNQHN